MTRSDLIKYVQNHTQNNRLYVVEESKTYRKTLVGFEKKGKGFTWHWFVINTYWSEGQEHEFVRFDHTYSQRTGRTFKGLRHGINITMQIEKALGIN